VQYEGQPGTYCCPSCTNIVSAFQQRSNPAGPNPIASPFDLGNGALGNFPNAAIGVAIPNQFGVMSKYPNPMITPQMQYQFQMMQMQMLTQQGMFGQSALSGMSPFAFPTAEFNLNVPENQMTITELDNTHFDSSQNLTVGQTKFVKWNLEFDDVEIAPIKPKSAFKPSPSFVINESMSLFGAREADTTQEETSMQVDAVVHEDLEFTQPIDFLIVPSIDLTSPIYGGVEGVQCSEPGDEGELVTKTDEQPSSAGRLDWTGYNVMSEIERHNKKPSEIYDEFVDYLLSGAV
jgi:hypothetical protein